MLYLGLDPGANGGIAIVDHNGTLVELYPLTDQAPADILDELQSVTLPAKAVLEHVWTSGHGHGGDFKLGRGFGWLEMALAAARMPFQLVLPKKWQAEFGISFGPGISSHAKKVVTKARAQQLFPGAPITHATADALLLAEYCRRFFRRIYGEEEDRPRRQQAQRTGQAVVDREAFLGTASSAGAAPVAEAAARDGGRPAHHAGQALRVHRRRARD